MIRVNYKSTEKSISKPEITTINIFNGKMFVRYNIPGKAMSVVKKMREDGRTNILYSRGVMIQLFPGKTEDEILEVAKKDIENGVLVAEQKTGKKIKIEDLEIIKIKK